MFGLKRIDRDLHRSKERPVSVVPVPVIVLLLLSLSAQLYWRASRPASVGEMSRLPSPPAIEVLQVMSIGEQAAPAYFLMLWLQAFDNQPGRSIPLKELDYPRVVAWLDTILRLNPKSQYPLLSAARIYSAVQDEAKQRIMLAFILEKYLAAPNRQWPAMAHASFIARHRLGDLPLALRYAGHLRRNTTDENAPAWVRQMELFVLEELGEIEAARILLGGLLTSGVIKDAQEFAFLQKRLGVANAPPESPLE